MRVPMVILALAMTPLLADVSAAQEKKNGSDKQERKEKAEQVAKSHQDPCTKPGLRTGWESVDWLLKHFDKACPKPAPAPAPTPSPEPTPTPATSTDSAPAPAPEPAPAPAPQATGTSITGVVYIDSDWSGVPNPGEPRLSGWTAQLLSNGTPVMTSVTDANGEFHFTDVVVGNYVVCVTPQPNYALFAPASGASCPSGVGYNASVTMYDLNVVFMGLDFGFYSTAP